MNIAFKDVKVGDKIYDSAHYAQNKWREVTAVKYKAKYVTLFVGVTAHKTIDTRIQRVGHQEEGIAVRRQS